MKSPFMIKAGSVLATLLLALSFTSCTDEEEAGPIVSENRSVPIYGQLEVSGDFEVVVGADLSSGVRIKAPLNRMNYVETYVTGGKLFIKERWNNVEKSDRIIIELAESNLSKIDLYGSGKIGGSMITAENLEMQVSGSGKIEFRVETTYLKGKVKGSGLLKVYGRTTHFDSEVNGSGSISARYLISQTAEANLNGSGSMELHAEEALTARVNGSGTISYWGNPSAIDTHVNGSGRIRKME